MYISKNHDTSMKHLKNPKGAKTIICLKPENNIHDKHHWIWRKNHFGLFFNE